MKNPTFQSDIGDLIKVLRECYAHPKQTERPHLRRLIRKLELRDWKTVYYFSGCSPRMSEAIRQCISNKELREYEQKEIA